MKISKIGLGSPRSFRFGANDKEAERLLREAFDLGINFFDTAPAYGSEHNLFALASVRDRVLFSTKSPHRLSIRAGWKTVPERLEKSLHESLALMGTDYLDFYFLHAVTLNVFNKVTDEIWETLKKFKKDGKVRFIGISEDVPFDPHHKMACVADTHPEVDILMVSDKHQWTPFKFGKPIVGMLVEGPLTKSHIDKYEVTLTGTSSIEHLKQNMRALDKEPETK